PLYFAHAYSRQTHFRTVAQSICINKARLQVQLLAERVNVAGSIKYEKDQYNDRNEHEDTDSQLAQTYSCSCSRHGISLSLSLMSSQKPLDVWILCPAQRFVRSTEDNSALAHHHHFAVNQTKPLALPFENDFALFVHHCILRTDVVEIVHLMGHEDR